VRGMSGGIAYILDEAGDLSAKVNPQMVTIESLAEEDVQILKGLLQKHVQYTGSAKAKEILEYWKEYGTKIFRVSSPSYLAAIRGKESVNQAV